MSEKVLQPGATISLDLEKIMERTGKGKIKIKAKNKSRYALQALLVTLLGLTVVAFATFDYQNIDFAEAVQATLQNIQTVFLEPELTRDTLTSVLFQLLVTFCLGILSTIIGAFFAFFCSLLCARNIASSRMVNGIKSFIAVVRAVPTVLWVLIFAVSAGLGSVAAVVGLTFHSFAYLTKAYAESIEEIEPGIIEALKANGASYWQIVFQAIVPSTITSMVAWTFMRFEINFTNAVAMGAAAGAGGIGFNLFMAGSFYFDLQEMGMLTSVSYTHLQFFEVSFVAACHKCQCTVDCFGFTAADRRVYKANLHCCQFFCACAGFCRCYRAHVTYNSAGFQIACQTVFAKEYILNDGAVRQNHQNDVTFFPDGFVIAFFCAASNQFCNGIFVQVVYIQFTSGFQ